MKTAILIVNGFDRRNYYGPHGAEQALAFPWIKLCLEQVYRHSGACDFEVFVYDNARLRAHRQILSHFPVHVFPSTLTYWLSRPLEHWYKDRVVRWLELPHASALDFLVAQLPDAFEYFITLDSDAFPIQDGWIETLTGCIDRGAAIAGIYRDEMAEALTPFVHLSALCMRVRDFRHNQFTFTRKEGGLDVGQSISLALYARGARIACLPRTNIRNYHFLIGGVYGNLVYHHGAGSRHAKFWTSSTSQDELARVDLRDRLFADPDSVVSYLLAAPYNQLPSPSIRVLEPGMYPDQRLSPADNAPESLSG